MVKKLLLGVWLLAGLCGNSLYAQDVKKLEVLKQAVSSTEKYEVIRHNGRMAKAVVPTIAKSKLDLKENEVWWGYFNGNFDGNDPLDWAKIGYGSPITYACCIKIPVYNDFDMGKGKTIEGIKFAFPDLKNIENVKIWMSTVQPKETAMGDCDICVQELNKADLVQALNSAPDNFYNEIRFDTPYTITDKDVFVGYTFSVTKVDDIYDQAPVVIEANPQNILGYSGAFMWRYNTETEWIEETTGDILAMQVLFSSNEFKNNAVNITESFQDVPMQKNSTEKQPLTLTSIGKQGLKNFKYVITTDGNVSDEQLVTLDKPIEEVGGKFTYEFPLKSQDKQGVYYTEIKITEVNGVANEGLFTEAFGDIIVVENVPERKVFIEDFTATWGKGAPFGFVNKIKLKELYGDRVVLVSIHNGKKDPMTSLEYDDYTYWNDINSFPTTDLDRTYRDVYPYLGTYSGQDFKYGYADDVDKALQQLSVATVNVSGKLSEDESTVDVEANVKFEFSGVKSNYALFYVLTEDGMQNEEWVQKNGMGQYVGIGLEGEEPLFEPYINGEEELKGVIYDNVVVASLGVYGGIEETISSEIKIDKIQTHKMAFDLSEFPIIQDKSKLSVCAVLLDTNSGKVVNANKGKVIAWGESSISSELVREEGLEIERYTVDGRKIQRPVKGINIVKYSNDRVLKELVR